MRLCICYTAALVTCVKNFPEKRGIVIGLLKGLIGLSGTIITQLALVFYGDQSVRHILLLIAWFPAAIALAFSFTIRPMEFQGQPNELRVFFHIFYVSLSLAVFLMIVTLCERFFTFPRIGYVGSGIVILFLLALPLLIAIREERFILSLKQQPDNHPFAINTGTTTEGAVVLPDAGQSQQDILMQKLGLAKGFVSELLLKQKGTPRPLMNVFALPLSCLGVLLIAFPSENGIYMATVIIGFSYGAQMTLLCTITSEIFGLKYYATLLNCTQFATPLGWFLLDNKLTQPMYHLEAKRLNMVVDGNLVCKGTTCFRGSFMIVAAVLVLGALASYVLARRTAKFYKGDVYKKFKD
ncbi:uncharacterized protein LOC18774566 [Prunus persica]|uniref:uncharacterized protein LOC18774566 n=1 Tax=Prunus persica TaxID=3760 RepID=UPI0009AB225C|nr:uncharacterized protein LOC18774566 [Prunus persica]